MVDFLEPLQTGEKSYGGFCDPKVAIADAIASHLWGDVADHKFLSSIILQGGAAWEDLHFVRDTLSFKEEVVTIDGGEHYRSMLTGKVAKDTHDRLRKLQLASAGQWLVIFTDANEAQKLMGSPLAGAVIKWKSRNGKQTMPERNEFDVMIELTAIDPVPEYPFAI